MCLILTVHLVEPDAARESEICFAAGIPIRPRKWQRFGFVHRPSGAIQIPGPEGGCGCSFLNDTATGDSLTWSMNYATVPRLTGILRSIRHQTSGSFSFDAMWIGESPTEECRVTIAELVHLVEQLKLGTKTRYLVD